MKKWLWFLGMVSILGLVSCKEESSEEGKQILTKLLNIVGIPHNIILNICQDDNDNGFCESLELQVKVTVNKMDTAKEIWEKVALSEEGQYLIENYDPKKKIIMEIQDRDNLTYNESRFSLVYNPKSIELSILQNMIDEGHLTSKEVKAVRKMNNVDDFYKVLLSDFEENLNILGEKDLISSQAVSALSKEMAEELQINGISAELPKKINKCDGNQTCVDEELNSISNALKIDENELIEIIKEETKKHKQLLSNKIFYRTYNRNSQIMKMSFDEYVTLFNWEIIEGLKKGERGVSDISIVEGSQLVTDSFNNLYLSIRDTFLLYENRETGNQERFYSNIDRAKFNTWFGKIEFYDESDKKISIPTGTKIRITPDEEQNENWKGIILSVDNEGNWATANESYTDINILNYRENNVYQFIVYSEDKPTEMYDFYNCEEGYLSLNRSEEGLRKSTAILSDFNQKTIKIIKGEKNCNSFLKVSNLISGKVLFYDEFNQTKPIPSDANIRIVPSEFQNDNDGWSGLSCTIDSNGNFGKECYTHEEKKVRESFTNNSTTYAIEVFQNLRQPDNIMMQCGDHLYKGTESSQAKDWSVINIYPSDYIFMDTKGCDDEN